MARYCASGKDNPYFCRIMRQAGAILVMCSMMSLIVSILFQIILDENGHEKLPHGLLNRSPFLNTSRVTDVTEFSPFGEKLYLSPILDLHSSDLVSYTISDRPVISMVTTMLDEAFAKIADGTNLILHSDQGWQYQHRRYQRTLREKGVRQSMSCKGNCLDNAVIEIFLGCSKVSCCICRSSAPWNTSNWN